MSNLAVQLVTMGIAATGLMLLVVIAAMVTWPDPPAPAPRWTPLPDPWAEARPVAVAAPVCPPTHPVTILIGRPPTARWAHP